MFFMKHGDLCSDRCAVENRPCPIRNMPQTPKEEHMSRRRVKMMVATLTVSLMVLMLIPLSAGQAQTPAPAPQGTEEKGESPAMQTSESQTVTASTPPAAGTPAAMTPAAMTAGPSVTVKDQPLTDNHVVIDTVMSDGPGWLVIHAQKGGTVGEVIGWAAVAGGNNSNVVIAFSDPSKVTPTLYAMLHVDKGAVGKYEFPGADVPAMSGGKMVNPSFKITGGMMPAAGMTPGTTPAAQ
jgi:hypothetical protein